MNALIFVESPLQVLNAVEAIDFFKIKAYKIIVRLSGLSRSDLQLLKTLKLLGIDSKYILIVKIKVLNRSIVDFLKVFFYSKRYIFSKYDFVFIGNADSGFFKQVKSQFLKSNLVYLDDGTKSLVLDRGSKDENQKFFSVFKSFNSSIFLNQYVCLKSMIRQKGYEVQKDVILFLGQKLAEAGIVSRAQYMSLVKDLALNYSEYKIIYILHRGEDIDKLTEISKISNIDLLELDYPVELYAMCNKTIPFKIVGFYSTALYTMKIIYGIEAENIPIKMEESEFKKNIDIIYSYYAANGIVASIKYSKS